MNKLKSLLWVALFATIAFSCSDDEEVVDVRAQAVGSYNYEMTAYVINSSGALTQFGSSDDGTFSVANDPANESGLIISEGSTKFTANKVTLASNGFSFDVPAQTIKDDDGTTLSISGYNGISLTSTGGSATLYNGGYITSTKKFTFWFQTVDPDSGITVVFKFDGTKN